MWSHPAPRAASAFPVQERFMPTATPNNHIGQPSTAAAGVLVILGASGDLTKRLLMPAVYNLACEGLLPDEFAIVGMALPDLTTAEFRAGQRQERNNFV